MTNLLKIFSVPRVQGSRKHTDFYFLENSYSVEGTEWVAIHPPCTNLLIQQEVRSWIDYYRGTTFVYQQTYSFFFHERELQLREFLEPTYCMLPYFSG